MNSYDFSGLLLATETLPFYRQTPVVLVALLVSIAASIIIGRALEKRFRMNDYWWKIALILSCLLCSIELSIAKWPPRLGVDLKGGVTFIGQLAPQEEGSQKVTVEQLIPHVKQRIDPTGTKEIVVRPLGDNKIEIIIPDVDDQEADRIWRRATTAGFLQFRIVADQRFHSSITVKHRDKDGKITRQEPGVNLFQIANNQQMGRPRTDLMVGKEKVARWVRLAREKDENGQPTEKFRFYPSRTHLCRDHDTGVIIKWNEVDVDPSLFHVWCEQRGIKEVDILMYTYDGHDVEGEHLKAVFQGYDERARLAVNFQVSAAGQSLFGGLTGDNTPNKRGTQGERLLGIVLDDALLSAPSIISRIEQNGQITGNFSQKEIEDLIGILKAGRMPAALSEDWISKDKVDSNIGKEMQEKGVWAIGISFSLVLIFMIIYYRFAGMVACFALLMNLALIVAMIMLIKQPITLTGLAGLVLTVGMSVDANVLIFERIREEVIRGSTLRMAIRNGFARATTTIVDANVTTLITAIVLYAIGTEQIKGFSVALILGILMSMFTAIFCSRVFFDVAERQRWITQLGMMRILSATSYDFIGKRQIAMIASVTLIAIGIFAVVYRGEGIFAHDLKGGTTARVVFRQPMETDEVRKMLEARFQGKAPFDSPVEVNGVAQEVEVSSISATDLPDGTVFKIDTSIKPAEGGGDQHQLGQILMDTFGDKLAHYSVNYTPLKIVDVSATVPTPGGQGNAPVINGAPDGGNGVAPEGGNGANPGTSSTPAGSDDTNGVPGGEQDKNSKGGDEDSASLGTSHAPAWVSLDDAKQPYYPTRLFSHQQDPPESTSGQGTENQAKSTQDDPTKQAGEAKQEGENNSNNANQADSTQTNPGSQEPVTIPNPTLQAFESTMTFGYPISADALRGAIIEQAVKDNLPLDEDDILLQSQDTETEGGKAFKNWKVTIVGLDQESISNILLAMKTELESQPYFRSLSGVGGQIAGKSQRDALMAIIASLIGIIIYIWIRFQRVVYGLAAVVALVHDVLVVLGAIAISYFLAGVLGFLQIDNFKISLPVVAAFLTIIGYSLNDTIVVFDRIREVRGKNPDLTGDMINRSIGQTLGRTLLTSMTTFIVVIILFWGGGDAIHGFAFALVVGVIVGTYSSIFVASPALLWMTRTLAQKNTLANKPPVAQKK